MIAPRSANSSEAEKYYDKLAPIYDQATHNQWSAPSHVSAIAMELATSETHILDIGIGTGQSIAALYEACRFKTIEAIDVSRTMLDQCAVKYPDIALHHGDFVTYTDFKRQNYDLIICCGVLEFMDDPENFIARCRDCLAGGGDLILTFEPVIDNHAVQNHAISPVQANPASEHAGFMTYRHTLESLAETGRLHGFELIFQTDFAAYQKGDAQIMYTLVHFRAAPV